MCQLIFQRLVLLHGARSDSDDEARELEHGEEARKARGTDA